MKGRVLNISHFVLCTQLFIVNDFATHHASYLLFRHFPIVKCTFCPFIHVHFRCWSHPVRPTADKKKTPNTTDVTILVERDRSFIWLRMEIDSKLVPIISLLWISITEVTKKKEKEWVATLITSKGEAPYSRGTQEHRCFFSDYISLFIYLLQTLV